MQRFVSGQPPCAINVLESCERCLRHASVQSMLTEDHAVLAETGDSWFNCQKLRLPRGCLYECASCTEIQAAATHGLQL